MTPPAERAAVCGPGRLPRVFELPELWPEPESPGAEFELPAETGSAKAGPRRRAGPKAAQAASFE